MLKMIMMRRFVVVKSNARLSRQLNASLIKHFSSTSTTSTSSTSTTTTSLSIKNSTAVVDASKQALLEDTGEHLIEDFKEPKVVQVKALWTPPSDEALSLMNEYKVDKDDKRRSGGHSMLSRFGNYCMQTSNDRQTAETMLCAGMLHLQQRTHQCPEQLFRQAISMLAPVIECGSMNRGAKNVRVPLPVTEHRGQAYAFRWLSEHLQKKRRPAQKLDDKFAAEVVAVLEGKSSLLQKKAAMHREALVNRANAAQRWGVGYRM